MRFAILGSGSAGNATVVEAAETSVLIDCGLSVRRLIQRTLDIGFDLATLSAVVVTHEHGDHIGGVAALARRYSIPAYMTHGTQIASSFDNERDVEIREISPHEPFTIGALDMRPAPVPHDAKEPCQFVVEHHGKRLGILTDLGSDTRHLRQHFADCMALVLEFNHDPVMLSECAYPDSVKARIAGRFGHFSNHQAKDMLECLKSNHLRHVFAAHVSERANSRELVDDLLGSVLAGQDVGWGIARQDRATPWIQV